MKSSLALSVVLISSLLSLSGTRTGFPAGFTIRSPSVVVSFFLPTSFSMAVRPRSFRS